MFKSREDWLRWRQQGIGGSDIAVLFGLSKWMTLRDLYDSKMATEIKEETNFVQELGNDLEPQLRDVFGFITDEVYQVSAVVVDDRPFLRASLDGQGKINPKQIIEIKLLGKADYENTQKGIIPEHYRPQVQHNLLCSASDVCHFLGYPYEEFKKTRRVESNLIARIDVKPDEAFQLEIIKRATEFWNVYILTKNPPEPDYASLEKHKTLIRKFKILKAKSEKLDSEIENIRVAILKIAQEEGKKCYEQDGVRIREEIRSGSVNYKSIPELKGIDLEQYRGKCSTFWKIEVI